MELKHFIFSLVLIPVSVAFFKKEIGDFITAFSIYRNRRFDEDRDPNTPDTCQLLNPAKGKWTTVIIEKYVFSLNKNKSGVYVLHPCKNNKHAREIFRFSDWDKIRKRELPK